MSERGRPSIYTEEMAAEICRRLTAGESLRSICRDEGMPDESTVRMWALDDKHAFYPQYARARTIGYHSMADELIEIADHTALDTVTDENGTERANHEWISRSRLRVDTRKWMLSKALPKVYGDRITADVNHGIDPESIGSTPLELARGLAFVLALAQREAGTSTAAPAAPPTKH